MAFSNLQLSMGHPHYGFAALEHRFRVLGGKPFEIHESRRSDLARLLVALYGIAYIGHPRLTRLIEKNKISDLGFLTGADEATSFDNGEYVKLHQSTLRKVDILANIVGRTVDGTLKTNARRREIHGGYCAFAVEAMKEHWFFVLICILGAVASIVGLVL